MSNDSISLEISEFKAKFEGKILNDSVISGQVIQGRNFPLLLKKVNKISRLTRPQTPQPPFTYTTEDVEYDSKNKSLHYGATITIPNGKGPFPAALLITGSGAQNRDEEIMEHMPFAVIADYLTKNSYIILRVDDRGTGKSTGNFGQSTTADFANDVQTSLNYLKSRQEVDKTRMGMIGHSEGGMIAPLVASQRKDIDFIILLGAPGEKISKLMEDQNVAIMVSSGIPKQAAESYRLLFRKIIPVIVHAKTVENAKSKLNKTVDDWKNITSKNDVLVTTGIRDKTSQNLFVNSFAESLSSPWYKYFLQFDPQPYLQKLSCKVLALNGEKDLQVLSKPNLAAIKAALKKSKSVTFDVKEIPGHNHLFQHCKRCTIKEYGEIEESFSTDVLIIMTTWLHKNVKPTGQ